MVVFPVHTGVFLIQRGKLIFCHSLPRAYGGVSILTIDNGKIKKSSPCIRGCFRVLGHRVGLHPVFPVHTGVFLILRAYTGSSLGLPRAYGGVSRSI